MQRRDIDVFDAAAIFWGGGYDESTETLTQGPLEISIRTRSVQPSGCKLPYMRLAEP
jgi:hypothetical protein